MAISNMDIENRRVSRPQDGKRKNGLWLGGGGLLDELMVRASEPQFIVYSAWPCCIAYCTHVHWHMKSEIIGDWFHFLSPSLAHRTQMFKRLALDCSSSALIEHRQKKHKVLQLRQSPPTTRAYYHTLPPASFKCTAFNCFLLVVYKY